MRRLLKKILIFTVAAAMLMPALTFSLGASADLVPAEPARVILEAADAACTEGAIIKSDYLESKSTAVLLTEDGGCAWQFTAEQAGEYEISVTYAAGSEAGGDLEFELFLDGESPFKSSSLIQLKRTFRQKTKFEKNIKGDHVKPAVTEEFRWRETRLRDITGYKSENYRVSLTAGAHTLALQGSRGTTAIARIIFEQPEAILSYKEYAEKNASYNTASASLDIIEGESFTYKSDTTILPAADTESPITSPSSSANRLLNTVGGGSWKQLGSFVTWEIEVPETGLYALDIRFRQNIADGIYSSRRLLIDEQIPFKEAAGLRFMYEDDWQSVRLGGDEPYLFLLTEGSHTLTLEAVMGDAADLVDKVETAVLSLNEIRRNIEMITGVSPDIYRDYHFEKLIPDELLKIEAIYSQLQGAVNEIKKQTGVSGSYTSVIQKLLYLLKKITDTPASIAKNYSQFKSYLGALGTWILSAGEQPLQIDTLRFAAPDEALPKGAAGFFATLWFQIKSFIGSFFTDYSAVGILKEDDFEGEISVWMQTGRDQAEILRELIDTGFAPKYKASVNLKVVVPDTVLQSTLAGRGPDIVLNTASSEPINYAIRNAVLDLTKFKDYSETAKRFFDAAVAPFRFQNSVYALPETFTFPMFFYRTDIFADLELSPPETWEEMLLLIPEIQGMSMSMAFPSAVVGYSTVLFQNKGELYRDGGARTNLDSETALSSFKEFTELFTLHNLPVQYDFANRFRTGEMPCGIADYSIYNTLSVFAPEIRGLWKMTPLPGKAEKNGEISRATSGVSVGSMILSSAKDPELCWTFMKWWLSDSIQSEYGRALESVLGAAAKYTTANKNSLQRMTWSKAEYTALLEQAAHVRALPEMPGSYYLARVISFAFNRSYNASAEEKMAENPVEVMRDYIVEFNDELTRKRSEFGLK